MKLFVVNATAQNRQVYYRLDYALDDNGNRRDGQTLPPKFRDIPAGEQVLFADVDASQMDGLIQQLEFSAGAVNVDEVRTAKVKGVVKLIWSLDKPVARPICEDVKAHNMGRLTEVGADRRRQLAIVSDYKLRQINDELGTTNPSTGLEMSVESVGEEDPEMTAPKLAEGLRVKPGADGPARGRPRRAA